MQSQVHDEIPPSDPQSILPASASEIDWRIQQEYSVFKSLQNGEKEKLIKQNNDHIPPVR